MTCTRPFVAPCLAAFALAAFALAAVPVQADESRGWRSGSDPFGQSDSHRVAHYTSNGLYPGDKVSIVFGSSGANPIALYNLLGDPDGMFDAFVQVDQDVPGLIPALQEDCYLRPSVGKDEDAIAFCVLEDLMSDAYAELSVLVDLTDLAQGDDPVHRVAAVGVIDTRTDAFTPYLEVPAGAICNADQAGSLCAVCFTDFQSLAFGEGGETCGATIVTPALAAVQMTTPWFDFVSLPIDKAKNFDQLKIAVRFLRQSGATYDISYDSDDLMPALFGPGG